MCVRRRITVGLVAYAKCLPFVHSHKTPALRSAAGVQTDIQRTTNTGDAAPTLHPLERTHAHPAHTQHNCPIRPGGATGHEISPARFRASHAPRFVCGVRGQNNKQKRRPSVGHAHSCDGHTHTHTPYKQLKCEGKMYNFRDAQCVLSLSLTRSCWAYACCTHAFPLSWLLHNAHIQNKLWFLKGEGVRVGVCGEVGWFLCCAYTIRQHAVCATLTVRVCVCVFACAVRGNGVGV